jgi:hypothetical protein
MGYNKSMINAVGLTSLMGGGIEVLTTEIDSFAKLIPGLGKAITAVNNELKKVLPAGAKPASDAVMVNDGVIQFHPADKFATVPDGAALLASTGTGQLASAVDKLTGGGKTAVVDPGPIAAAVAAAVQQAMSGMKIEMDGYNLAKAMEFSNRTLNG